MSFEQKDNTGAIFVNDRKEKDTHPDRTGSAMIDGREYYISGWLKTGKRGQFLSLSFKPKDGDQLTRSRDSQRNDVDQEIPF